METSKTLTAKIRTLPICGFQGKPVSATENNVLTGLKQAGILLGVTLEDDTRAMVFVPANGENGDESKAHHSLLTHAFGWALSPGRDALDVRFTGQDGTLPLEREIEGAKTLFVADRGFDVLAKSPPVYRTPLFFPA